MAPTLYYYWPVSGCTVFWQQPGKSFIKARNAVQALLPNWPYVEVERVRFLDEDGTTRRYWRRRRGRWSVHHHLDPTPKDLAHWHPKTIQTSETRSNG